MGVQTLSENKNWETGKEMLFCSVFPSLIKEEIFRYTKGTRYPKH